MGSITSAWHSQADFCFIPSIASELCLCLERDFGNEKFCFSQTELSVNSGKYSLLERKLEKICITASQKITQDGEVLPAVRTCFRDVTWLKFPSFIYFLPQVRTLVCLHPPTVSTALLNMRLHHHILALQAQSIALMKINAFKKHLGVEYKI